MSERDEEKKKKKNNNINIPEPWVREVDDGDVNAIREIISNVKNLDFDKYKKFGLSVADKFPFYWLEFTFDSSVELVLEDIQILKVKLFGRVTRSQIKYNKSEDKQVLGIEIRKISLMKRIEKEDADFSRTSSSSIRKRSRR